LPRRVPGVSRPLLTAAVLISAAAPVVAQPIAHPVATFAGLDKITGRITRFDVYVDETVLFGALEITPRACYERPATDTVQRTTAFLEVNQMSLDGTSERIFTGWMFADSPALSAVDHAVYDVWLIECKVTTNVPPPDQR
jgi:hypothetical protein